MLAFGSHHKYIRRFWLLMALYVLNICVDSPDASKTNSENLSINDQESVIELVVEKVLDLGNIIPEQDDADSEKHNTQKPATTLDHFIISNTSQQQISATYRHQREKAFSRTVSMSSAFLEIDAPPPRI